MVSRWKVRKIAKFVIKQQGVSTGCHVKFAMAGFTRAVLKLMMKLIKCYIGCHLMTCEKVFSINSSLSPPGFVPFDEVLLYTKLFQN